MDESIKKLLALSELGGDFTKIKITLLSGENTAVFSSNLSERAVILSGINKPFIYVANDRLSAFQAYETLKAYSDGVYLLNEREEQLVYRGAVGDRGATLRVSALSAAKEGQCRILVMTREAVLQRYPSPNTLTTLTLSTGESYDFKSLSESLIKCGLKRVDTVENMGEFSFNGDICTVFLPDYTNPLRISFFDDTVEYIVEYDIDTLSKLGARDSVKITSGREFAITDDAIARAYADLKSIKGDARNRAQEILDEIRFHYEADPSSAQAQWLAPYLNDNTDIFSYFTSPIIAIEDGATFYDKAKVAYNEFVDRHLGLITDGEVLPLHIRNLMPENEFKERTNKLTKLVFSGISSISKEFRFKSNFNFNSAPPANYYMNFNGFYSDIKKYNLRGMFTVICCGDEHTAKSIKNSLYDNGIFAEYQVSVERKSSGVVVTPAYLPTGFVSEKSKLVVIGRNQLIRKKEKPIARRKRRLSVMPKCGDYVVHEVHGIGLCTGTETITDRGVSKEYVVLQYYGNNKLYVPVDQMDRLERYSGSDIAPKLSKIGGKDWERVTATVKKAVKEMAFSLVELYRVRQQEVGFKYSSDCELQKEFEDSFEWQETDDQLRAVKEIKEDMERGIVMDRLICGDVGYGKTEVALRAVFKTIMDNKQAAILAPTTILARQHYNTAMARFNDYGINVALLTRFQPKEEIDKAIKDIKSGKVNVIIATHKLLSDKIEFHDLGLLVLDEEQRFGVEHKEKLKVGISKVNVLTLSATPIPRTLSMALTGIRDISVLETPPKERLPIATYVTEMSDRLLGDAITRELARDGQVFVLYNRVDSISSIANRIAELVPEARVGIGHGQMPSRVLEDAINKFYSGETNVFVATTIIENGVDLPNANTIIVYDADRLGLSAMYQLRGRVGRSNRQAYAYFTTPSRKSLTEDAVKRLNAVMDYTEFGSGYKIAMRDLEIRGAGNVLGREQSGHIVKVGYDMYCKLLEDAVEELNGEEIKPVSDTEMQVDIDAYLDDKYIGNTNEKIRVFKEIAEVSSIAERDGLIEKLEMNYGLPSPSLVNLLEIALLKNLAGAIGAKKVVINNGGVGIEFTPNVFKNQAVIDAISNKSDICSLEISDNPRIVFDLDGKSISQKIAFIKEFLLNAQKTV